MWKVLSSKKIFKHPRITLIEDEILLPSGKKTTYLKFGSRGHAAEIVCVRGDGKILLQIEYSHPSRQKLWQFPGGLVSSKEKPEIGANRELMEEAGFKAKKLEILGSYLGNHRRSTFRHYVYLATDLKEATLVGDDEEDIESFWFFEDEIEEMIRNGKIINCNALTAWALFRARKDKINQGEKNSK